MVGSNQRFARLRRLGRRSLSGRKSEQPHHPVVVPDVAADITPRDREILEAVSDHTMTSVERQVALLDAVDYIVDSNVPGAFVECGVWRGGSVLAMVLRLQQRRAAPRDLYLYDTFEGMTRPTELDTSDYHRPALEDWQETGGRPYPHMFSPERFGHDMVRRLLEETGYPPDRIHLVVGAVEDTLPATVPDTVALLRLDTDWYESTRDELEHLYPRLSPGGVAIVDDYGHWQGCRRAVDEFFDRGDHRRPLMFRVDYACRSWTRPVDVS